MTLNELVKLTTLWTTGPRYIRAAYAYVRRLIGASAVRFRITIDTVEYTQWAKRPNEIVRMGRMTFLLVLKSLKVPFRLMWFKLWAVTTQQPGLIDLYAYAVSVGPDCMRSLVVLFDATTAKDTLSRQRRFWSVCAHAQYDLDFACLYAYAWETSLFVLRVLVTAYIIGF